MVTGLMNVVMEIMALVMIVKHPVTMKIMMAVKTNPEKMVELRGMMRRIVAMKEKKNWSQIKTTKQTVMEMMTNQGKMVELMGVVRMIAVMKKKQMMSWIKKTKQMVMEMMDAVMEIMAVMINMTKNKQKRVDIRRNQDLLLTVWLNQKKNQPC
jgi:hypothetical protein